MSKRQKIILISVSTVAILAIATFTMAPITTELALTICWFILVVALIVIGNKILFTAFDKKLPWLKFGNSRYFLQLLVSLVVALLILNTTYLLLKLIFTEDPPTVFQLLTMNIYGTIILIPFITIYFSFRFLQSWKKAEVQAEQFHKESVQAQLDVLKGQLDPHFLFNNLNILSSLIDTDQQQSKEYLDRFAMVYRSILKYEKSELVTLKEELDLVENYLYLLKVRFGDLLIVEKAVNKGCLDRYLPPLSIQLLIENVIKHNKVTEKKPLNIIISAKDDWLKVSNELNLKDDGEEPVSRKGLSNIKSRYNFYTDQKVVIFNDKTNFSVKIPLLVIED